MDSLPNEILVFIFRDLNLDDLFNKCRLVCKRWTNVIDEHLKPEELIIFKKFCNLNNFWCHTYAGIDPKNLICTSNFHLDQSSFKRNFANIRHLKIDYPIKEENNLNFLSEFAVHLVHLELTNIIKLKKSTSLRLPCLTTFFIMFDSRGCELLVDSNHLKYLFANYLSRLKIIHGEPIEFIQTDNYHDFHKFNNLRTLKVNIINFSENHLNILSHVPDSLKRLHFYSDYYFREASIFFNRILDEREELHKLDLQMFYNGVQLVVGRSFDDYGFDTQNDIELHFRNYEILEDKLPQCIEFNYNDLRRIYHRFPVDFFAKYLNIQLINAKEQVMSEQHFSWFLRNCPNLSILRLVKPSLSQEFYDHLPDFVPLLTSLILMGETAVLNHEFVLRFALLIKFYTHTAVHMKTALRAVRTLRFIESFHFMDENKRIIIYKRARCLYDLKYGLKKPHYLADMDYDLLEHVCRNLDTIKLTRPPSLCSNM